MIGGIPRNLVDSPGSLDVLRIRMHSQAILSRRSNNNSHPPTRSIQHQQQDIRRCLSIYCYDTRTLASSRRWPPVRSVRPGALAALATGQSTVQQSRAAMTPAQRARLGYNTYSDLDIPGTSTDIMYMTQFVLKLDLEEVLGKTSPSGLATLAVVSGMSCPRGPLWCR